MRDGNDLLVLMLSNSVVGGRVVRRSYETDGPLHEECICMRLHSYRDESHSRHFDLIGGGSHRWSIDLVYVTASAILVVGFACALMAHWVR